MTCPNPDMNPFFNTPEIDKEYCEIIEDRISYIDDSVEKMIDAELEKLGIPMPGTIDSFMVDK